MASGCFPPDSGAAASMTSFRSPEAQRGATLVAWSHIVLLVAASCSAAGEAWLLFYLPVWLGRFWLSVVFGWLPHHPHVEVGRYRDLAIPFFGSTFLVPVATFTTFSTCSTCRTIDSVRCGGAWTPGCSGGAYRGRGWH